MFKQVRKEFPESTLDIVGDFVFYANEYKTQILEYIEKEQLQRSVRFHGWRNPVYPFYKTADLLLHLPRFAEPFGLVLIEAASYGLPVVTFNKGGMPEIVLDQKTGFLVPDGDLEFAAERCIQLLENRDLVLRMGGAARMQVAETFDMKKSIDQLIGLYEELKRPSV